MKNTKKFELHKAVIDGNLELVKTLISKGYDINEKDEHSFTPLHYATQEFSTKKECLEISKKLLCSGADIEARDNYGNTPLSKAVYLFRGDPSLINFLLEKGADKFNKNDYGVSPYGLAETIANYPVLQYLK